MTIFITREPEREVDDPAAAGKDRGGLDDFDNPDVLDEDEYDHPLDWISDELHGLASEALHDPGSPTPRDRCGWPPSEEWTRRLRAVLAEVEGAQRGARGDDPPDSGESLGLETRGGA